MRLATLVLLTLVACTDLRDFRGDWHGQRVNGVPALQVGPGSDCVLSIDSIDEHGFAGRLTVNKLLPETSITSLAGAEADVLAGMTFSGSPLRVYLAFAAVPDAGGDALAMIALYDDRRVEVRVLRGGAVPLYAIFALTESST